MKKKIFITMCLILALAAGCVKNNTENPDNQNQEASNNDNVNNENQNTDEQNNGDDSEEGKQVLQPTLAVPSTTPTEEPTAEPTPTEEIADEDYYTYTEKNTTMYTTKSLQVRDLPSSEGDNIGELSKGEAVKVTGICVETGWYRISYKEKNAYVSSDYLSETKPEETTTTPTPTKEPETSEYTYTKKDVTMYATESNVNVRNQPNTKEKRIGALKKGEEVKVTGVCDQNGWYRISYKGKEGYVASDYLTTKKTSETTSETTPTPEQKPASYTYTAKSGKMYTTGSVFVRNEPHTSGAIIGDLTKNTKITITGLCNETGWYRIEYDGDVGYVSGTYLTEKLLSGSME